MFDIATQPFRFWKISDMHRVMKTCTILQNMIIENQRPDDIDEILLWEREHQGLLLIPSESQRLQE